MAAAEACSVTIPTLSLINLLPLLHVHLSRYLPCYSLMQKYMRNTGDPALDYLPPLMLCVYPPGCLTYQSLMREHMRNADRALSNIEGMPEGFNALRRI